MKTSVKFVRILFALPWLVFGLQHFMYAGFVATLVPTFVPFKLFWAYFTGAAMIAAGIAFIVNRAGKWAAQLLGLMLCIFILLIHAPALVGNPFTVAALTRPLQDVALACACFFLATIFSPPETGSMFDRIVKISRYALGAMVIGFGIQQLFDLDFLTGKIPLYFPVRSYWTNLTAALMLAVGLSIIVNKWAQTAAVSLAVFLLLINLLNHGYLLSNKPHEPLLWTAAMLDLAVTFGIMIFALSRSSESKV